MELCCLTILSNLVSGPRERCELGRSCGKGFVTSQVIILLSSSGAVGSEAKNQDSAF